MTLHIMPQPSLKNVAEQVINMYIYGGHEYHDRSMVIVKFEHLKAGKCFPTQENTYSPKCPNIPKKQNLGLNIKMLEYLK